MVNLFIRTCQIVSIIGVFFIQNAFGQFQTSPHIIVVMADDLVSRSIKRTEIFAYISRRFRIKNIIFQ